MGPVSAARPAADGAELLDYLNQGVAWYRGIASMAPLATDPAEVLTFNDARGTALETLRFAFESARAETALLPAAPIAEDGRAGAGAESGWQASTHILQRVGIHSDRTGRRTRARTEPGYSGSAGRSQGGAGRGKNHQSTRSR